MSDTLFQRLDVEEKDVRERLERLRSEVASLEERLAHLAITRRTAEQLLDSSDGDEAPDRADPPEETAEADGEQAEEAQTTSVADEAPLPPDPAEKVSAGSPSDRKTKSTSTTSDRRPRLGPVSRKILLLVSGSDRPLRARDIAVALGNKDPKRTHIEGARTTLKKLVDQGYLTKVEAGLFASADASAKGAA